jgi:hypothetical protein
VIAFFQSLFDPANAVDLLAIFISVIAIVISLLSYFAARKANQDALWSIRFETYRDIRMKENFRDVLKLAGISEKNLEDDDIEKLKNYQLFLYPLWAESKIMRGHTRIEKTRDKKDEAHLEKKMKIIKKHHYHEIWYEECMSGRIIRSKEFQKAWLVIKELWDYGKDAVLVPLIEVIIDETNNTHTDQQN